MFFSLVQGYEMMKFGIPCREVSKVSKRCKTIIYFILGMVVLCVVALLIKLLFFSGLFIPMIQLNGKDHMRVEVHEPFDDPGATARFQFRNYSEEVQVEGDLDLTKLGTYTMIYTFEEYDKKVERTIDVVDTVKPEITLEGADTIRVFENGTYLDPGYTAVDNYDGDISTNVVVNQDIDMSKKGIYTVTYTIHDSSGNEATKTREVEVCADPTSMKLHYDYDSYDNKAEEWWFHKSENHERNKAAMDEEVLKSYGGYFLGPDEKVLYLTFDEGGNDITYIKEIADVLNENGVTATFFLTRNYIRDNADFINDLVKHGHVIGNHTWHHYDMTTLANAQGVDSFVKEITETEKTYMEVTGEAMKKVFRFPKGGSSVRALKMVQDMGYTTYNWSHAYYDYASDVSGEEALKTLLDHYHNGAIYLLHPSNKGNYEAMETFIKTMMKEGYRFETVDTIPEVS